MTTAQILDAVNARFYERFAGDFHQSRRHGWTGWTHLLADVPRDDLRILDIGCGNGRFAQFLAEMVHHSDNREVKMYLGLDQSDGLLEHAKPRTLPFEVQWATWAWADILDSDELDDGLGAYDGFDWIVLFGVMHHIYGFERRCRLIEWAIRKLRPNGLLTLSLWDFGADPRWTKKYVPWTDFTSAWTLDPSTLEAGDYLLGWSGHRDTPRYCHWMSRDEERAFVERINTRCSDMTHPGRRIDTGPDLNRYWSWRARGAV